MKALQITLILSMGLLLFGAAVLPPGWLAASCAAALLVVVMVARRQRTLEPAKPRRWVRTALGMVAAIGFILWTLLRRV